MAAERRLLPPGGAWILAELGADTPEAAGEAAERFTAALRGGASGPEIRMFADPADEHRVWSIRESGLGAAARGLGAAITWEGWEDSAVPVDRVGDYLRDIVRLWDAYGYRGAWYGHIGEGCVHTRNDFDLRSAQGIRDYRAYVEEAAELCVSYGGSLSGEHGDGQARGELLGKMFSPELIQGFRDFKTLWDPDGMMNPGKLVDAYPLDANLRLGAGYRPVSLGDTHFQFPEDDGDFAEATLRCVGVGKCRQESGGTMCPSYMVTREEKHSTRGRARLLFEMLQGEVTPATWDNADVKDALDLCISCKGCAGECPVSVDMATYKSEFLSHYYEGNRRPRHAYALGLIDLGARAAAKVPRLANLVTHAPGLRRLVARAAGVTPRREIPRFATETLTEWFAQRAPVNTAGPQVILWPDTFTNYLHPEPGRAAVEVLEAAGLRVRLPGRALCCGRPLYDYGMLTRAKRLLRDVLDALRDDIVAGTPIVGLEPSCLAVFRDELVNLFPHDEDAKRLAKQTFTLSEFLLDVAQGYSPPRVDRRARVQGHCHQTNIWGMDADRRMMAAMGLDAEIMDSGCCGLAGSFGFEAEHYDASMAMGERALFPMIRATEKDALVLADGFSCRTQIAHGTERRALHLAEVLRMGLRARGR
jgi:Fe-S oxidoreductase